MSDWRPTASLTRAVLLAAMGLGPALLVGSPAGAVLAAPFLLWTALALRHRPRCRPRVRRVLDHAQVPEGRTTTSRLVVEDAAGAVWVTRATGSTPYVGLRPRAGAVAGQLGGGMSPPVVGVRPLRWGRRAHGAEVVTLLSAWAGFRHGPTRLDADALLALPAPAPFDVTAEAPHPVGLVGAHRSRRAGTGTELADIRAFRAGDRLRRIDWRVSLRTGELHVVDTRAEQDTGVLLVVDALADHGASGGIDAGASSLDVGVRAASALAAHFVRNGDRVALQVVGRAGERIAAGSGARHLHRLQGTLAALHAGEPRGRSGADARLRLPVPAGATVIVLSPVVHEALAGVTLELSSRGLPLLVVDTLVAPQALATGEGHERWAAELAWRLRLIDRGELLDELTRRGTPVVAWHGPGTLDLVLRRLARRNRLPQVAR